MKSIISLGRVSYTSVEQPFQTTKHDRLLAAALATAAALVALWAPAYLSLLDNFGGEYAVRSEMFEWLLVVIAAFYLSFAAYFEASTHAWQTEIVGVAVFLACAVGGLFSRPAIAIGYVMHGLWDLSHCLSGASLAGLSMTEIPLGYGIFCSTYDFTVACYLMISDTAWHEPGRFDLYFWRTPTR